ncbi:hypothetical protein AUP74_00667 [Microbulbifer aggregans]|uniref:Uncharacterized protein n=1 Tax=Microbulbifer aggregans TaxID=1769779 RepID=A0A1C9W4Q1_9GAMM|nr:hypothetical protein AUP74_00667 [Microbulbifer aggregans]
MTIPELEQLMTGKRVFRSIAIPIQAFDALQGLKRRHNLANNNEVISYALIRTEEETSPPNEQSTQCTAVHR